jgi:hypothetical protein
MSDPSRPKPFQPRGALDGNICDTTMAQNMSFLLRWGNSCGIPFLKDKFCDENAEWDYLRPYLEDRPQQQWTEFSITNTYSKGDLKRRSIRNNGKKNNNKKKSMKKI